jgi:hypothetical protein
MTLLLWLACAATESVTSAVTDDGLWQVSLVAESAPIGQAVVALDVKPASGDGPRSEPSVSVEAGMEGMDHATGEVPAEAGGNGRYEAALALSMRGAWYLDVTVTDAQGSGVARLDLLVE